MASALFGLLAIQFVFSGHVVTARPSCHGPVSAERVGCFDSEVDGVRVFSGSSITRDSMTVNKCAIHCLDRHFKYSGLEDGRNCYCGNDLPPVLVDDAACNVPCPGSPSQTCGGGNRLEIFGIFSAVSSAQPSSSQSLSSESSEASASSTQSSSELESSTTVSVIVSSIETVTSSTDITSSSEPIVSTSFSDESIMPSSTSSSESLASSTVFSPSSTLVSSSTTSAPYCDPTPTYLPEYCWASIPSPCSSLNRTPPLPSLILTASANACRNAFSANGALATVVAGCFQSMGRPQFKPTSAYSCVSESMAPLYCQSTTAPCDPYATPTATPVNGGFESGDISPWIKSSAWNPVPGNVDASVTSERSHSGENSVKITFAGVDGGSLFWTQDVKLVPGASYQLSYWWYSVNSEANTGTSVAVGMPGGGASLNQNTKGLATNQWVYASTTFVAPVSFGTISLKGGGNAGPANTMYVDDIELKLVS